MSADLTKPNDVTALMKSALLELQNLRGKLQAKEEPIAIVGMGCRVPGADSPEALWALLEAQRVVAQRQPDDRWDSAAFYDADPDVPGKSYLRSGSFLDSVDSFDADFFGISPREANKLDPQQRLLLEVSWEALENAGLPPDRLNGTATGVFVGVMNNEYVQHRVSQMAPEDFDSFVGTGNEPSFLAGRISYLLGLTGPSLVVATACSSSLVSVHLACQSIRNGECEVALAGGVNLILSPYTNIVLCKMRAVAEDGRSKTFAAGADGYGRGEGCGVVVLKRLSAARRDGDRILGIVRGSAIGHNGASMGLTVPNAPAQSALIEAALRNAKAQGSDLDYVELHGTGTELGDPIELRALAGVLGKRNHPLPVGALKGNIGHLEAAAGVAGLVKVVMAMRHGIIPGQPMAAAPNPHIPWSEMPIYVPSAATPWTVVGKRRLAGISSFGLSGSNAHIILEEAPEPAAADTLPDRSGLLVLSAKTPEALRELAGCHAAWFASHPDLRWADVCYTSQNGRTHFEHRLATVAVSLAEARFKLEAYAAGIPASGVWDGFSEAPPNVAFLFSGQGSQYLGMGLALYSEQPAFREAFNRCDAILQGYLGRPLREILQSEDLHQTRFTQPALFALEYALAALWQSWGITPAVMLGHSVGECAAACVAGILSLEDGLKMISERARLMQSLPAVGAMAAVLADEQVVRDAVAGSAGIAIAAFNGPSNVVISGLAAEVDAILAALSTRGIESVRLTVSHAFHSSLMDPILDEFEAVCGTLRFTSPKTYLISNETGRVARPLQMSDGAYWRRHLRHPVQFQAGMVALQEQRIQVFVEIGPKPVLLGMGRQCVAGADRARWVPSLRSAHTDAEVILAALAELYVQGAAIAWSRVTVGRITTLPTYRFQRRRYWMETVSAGSAGAPGGNVDFVGLAETAAASTALTEEQKRMFPALLTWLDRQLQPSKSDIVFDYYNALSQTASAAQGTVKEESIQPFLTFGPLPRIVPGFSWLLPMARPDEYAHFSHLSRQAQELMRELLFRQVDFDACRRALDFGCGYGSDLLRLAERYPAIEFEGFTISSEQARIGSANAVARGLSDRLHIQHRDSAVDPFPEELDLAFGFEVAHHIKDKPALFRNLSAHLKDGGYLVLADFISNAEFTIEHAETSSYFITKAEWTQLLSTHDLELIAAIDVSQEVANYLHDPNFTANLAEISKIGLHPHIKSALESYNGLGRLLRKGLASYVLLTARKRSGADAAALAVSNLECLSSLAPFSQSVPEQWLYRREWRNSVLRPAGSPDESDGVILVGGGAPGHALARELAGAKWLAAPEELPVALAGNLCRHVVLLCGLASTGPADVALTTAAALRAVQLVAQSGKFPRLWLVRRAGAPDQAVLDGLGSVIALEHDELRCTRLELPSKASATDAVLLAQELSAGDAEVQISYAGGGRAVARLAPSEAPPAAPVVLGDEGTYLITGGFGVLGLAVAEGMIRAGARRIALTGRNGSLGREAELASLERLGAVVEPFAVDVSDAAQVAALIASLPGLRGVIHAAGVLDDGTLVNQTPERFERVLAPKVGGSWNLHLATRQLPLDFFVCFSSLASLIGAPGQGSYAAGNAFLDALCELRRQEGLPALSINWGPWAGAGMAVRSEGAGRLDAQGVGSIEPSDGVALFLRLLAEPASASHIGVVRMDWQRFPAARAPYFAECTAAPLEEERAGSSRLRSLLAAAAPADRKRMMIAFLKDEVSRVLERDTPPSQRQGFADLGVDSLMTIELRNSIQTGLELSLPATLLYKYPTIEDLAAFLEVECFAAVQAEASPAEALIAGGDIDDELAAELSLLNAVLRV